MSEIAEAIKEEAIVQGEDPDDDELPVIPGMHDTKEGSNEEETLDIF